jgi:hypothetical protein
MLGVQTTPAERLALIKAGGAMMGTVGSPAKGLSNALMTYADELTAQNKAQMELASAQTMSKETEGKAQQAVAGSIKEIIKSPLGLVQSGVDKNMKPTISTTELPEAGNTVPVGGANKPGGGKTGTGAVNVGGEGQVMIDPDALKSVTPEDVANPAKASSKVQSVAQKIKDNFDLGSIYNDSPETADKEDILKKLAGKPNISQGGYSWDAWQTAFNKQKEEAQKSFEAANSSATNLGAYARQIARIPTKDSLFISGAKGEERMRLGSILATTANSLGISDEMMRKADIDPKKFREMTDAVVAATELNKLSNAYSRAQNPGMGVAVSWLEATKNSLPSIGNLPRANADLLGSMYAARAYAKDNFAVISRFGNMTQENGYGRTAAVVQKVNPAGNYSRDAEVAANLLDPTNPDMLHEVNGKKYNAVGLLLDGHMKPQEFNAFVLKKYGLHNASRMFQ